MAKSSADIHGLLVLDKPGMDVEAPISPDTERALPTSHDVVQQARRLTRQRRIGHTGTLDPMASGLLVLCMGQATRLVEYYQGHDKSYLARVTLGTATDTYDAVGQPTDTALIPTVTPSELEDTLGSFRGDILQSPPIFSALKQGGESLHRKARRGEVVTVEARKITIHQLDLIDWDGRQELMISVRCSAGTYIRSLANDIGRQLGTVAHLGALRRTRVGMFSLSDACTLPELDAAVAQDRQSSDAGFESPRGTDCGPALAELMLAPGDGLTFPEVLLGDESIRRLGHGQKIWVDAPDAIHGPAQTSHYATGQSTDVTEGVATYCDGSLRTARDAAGRFLGLIKVLDQQQDGGELWKAEKWLATT